MTDHSALGQSVPRPEATKVRRLSPRGLSYWRTWAALITLATDLDGYAFTSVIANRTNSMGWHVWPTNPREWTGACRRALERAERNHHVEAQRDGGEVYWHLTDIGLDFVETHLIGNPHITPEKFLEIMNPLDFDNGQGYRD